tara:strand:- start:10 stop:411 length:402 start_codon:yes stop_codon:yes gene_type:complete
MLIKKTNKSIGLKFLILSFTSIFLSMSALAISNTGFVGDDEIEIAVNRIFNQPANYPRKALRKGQEGFVVIEFDIDTDGGVLDPYVLESEPAGVFERSAIKAVRKWLYEAPSYNGVSVKVNNVQVKVSFNLAD